MKKCPREPAKAQDQVAVAFNSTDPNGEPKELPQREGLFFNLPGPREL